MSATMTPKCRKATIEELMKWAELHHPRPEKFLRKLAETNDEDLWYLVTNNTLEELKTLFQCVIYDDQRIFDPGGQPAPG